MTYERQEPLWLDTRDAITIHARQLAEFGGPEGMRDQGLLESALAKPVNKWSYGDNDLASLAASYAFGLVRNHPFADGNKRTAWVLARLFLMFNGEKIKFEKDDAIRTMIILAAGELAEEQLANWFREHIAD